MEYTIVWPIEPRPINRKKLSTSQYLLERLTVVKEYIDEAYTKPFVLRELALKAYMSKYSLVRCFKEAYNTTPHRYFISKRMTYAKHLLSLGYQIKQIAELCGYPDIYSFSKQYKMSFGIAPRFEQKDLPRNSSILKNYKTYP